MIPTEAKEIARTLQGKSWRDVTHEHEIRKFINHTVSEMVIDLDDHDQINTKLLDGMTAQEIVYAYREIKQIKKHIENNEYWGMS